MKSPKIGSGICSKMICTLHSANNIDANQKKFGVKSRGELLWYHSIQRKIEKVYKSGHQLNRL